MRVCVCVYSILGMFYSRRYSQKEASNHCVERTKPGVTRRSSTHPRYSHTQHGPLPPSLASTIDTRGSPTHLLQELPTCYLELFPIEGTLLFHVNQLEFRPEGTEGTHGLPGGGIIGGSEESSQAHNGFAKGGGLYIYSIRII